MRFLYTYPPPPKKNPARNIIEKLEKSMTRVI